MSIHFLAAQLTTPAENPLVGDDTRLSDVWFDGSAVRKQLFKKVHKTEQEAMAQDLENKGFIRSGNLLIVAEMEHEIVGGEDGSWIDPTDAGAEERSSHRIQTSFFCLARSAFGHWL